MALYSQDQLAAHFGVTPKTSTRWARRGCPHFRPSKKTLRFDLSSVLRWCAAELEGSYDPAGREAESREIGRAARAAAKKGGNR